MRFLKWFSFILVVATFSCRSPVPYFPERNFPDPPWVNTANNGIVVRYIPFDRPPEPLQPIVISWTRESQTPDTVTVLVFIHEDGDASDPSIINQTLNPELTDLISSLVTQTEFRPAMQNSHPIAAWIELPIRIQKGN